MKLTYNDAQHAYWLDGNRCKSVTTVAKIPDDTYNLNQWQLRQVAIGLAMKPALVEAVAAHVDDKDQLSALCEEAKKAAGANDAARRGTAAHRITEMVDQGREIIATDLSTKISAQWREALDAAGLEYVAEWAERVVVWPDRLICGRFDRFLRRRSDGRLVVADLKTGAKALDYPHSIALQLAAYANAPLIAAPLPGESGSTERFDASPADLDRSVGYVISLTEQGVTVAEIDIAAGLEALEAICWPVLAWRKRKDLILRTTKPAAPPRATAPAAALPGAAQHPDPAFTEAIRQMEAMPSAAMEDLARAWPLGVPSPYAIREEGAARATPEQAALLLEIVHQVAARHRLPFLDAPVDNDEPFPPLSSAITGPPRAPGPRTLPPIDEGERLTETELAALSAEITALEPASFAAVNVIVQQSVDFGRKLNVSGAPCRRRGDIARALLDIVGIVNLAEFAGIVRQLVDLTLGAEQQGVFTTGALIGSFTLDEAARFRALASSFVLRFDDQGQPVVMAA